MEEYFARSHKDTKFMTENEIGTIIIDSAVRLHKEIGPGLLESVYEVLLASELKSRGLNVETASFYPDQL